MKEQKNIKPRVITGIFKGKRLDVPQNTRPVTDRVKVSIFDSINDIVSGAMTADIFCGSGNLGIEALSRGAYFVTFVDIADESISFLQKNISQLQIPDEVYAIVKGSYATFLKDAPNDEYDLLFLDPPFTLSEKFTHDVDDFERILKNYGLIVLKLPSKVIPDVKNSNLKTQIVKSFGANTVYFIQKMQDRSEV